MKLYSKRWECRNKASRHGVRNSRESGVNLVCSARDVESGKSMLGTSDVRRRKYASPLSGTLDACRTLVAMVVVQG
jgi:hypothetical protein